MPVVARFGGPVCLVALRQQDLEDLCSCAITLLAGEVALLMPMGV